MVLSGSATVHLEDNDQAGGDLLHEGRNGQVRQRTWGERPRAMVHDGALCV